ncbi:MAG TPA: VOC family protein [Acidobacteriaceae bacterium]
MDSASPQSCPPAPIRFHHVGFVVASIEEGAASFGASLGATWDGNVVYDPLQKVRVTFLRTHAEDATIELVEPGDPDSPVSRFLSRGGGLHHLCYEVPDLEAHLAFSKSVGAIIIRPPVPAVAFGGRRIAWALTKKRLLVEFLEASAVVIS